MLNAELIGLMKPYVQRGVADWRDAPAPIRQRALVCLANKIADKEHEALEAIEKFRNGVVLVQPRFIPMPNIQKKETHYFFFLPFGKSDENGDIRAYFDLVVLVEDQKCLGFRFEPADLPDRAHGYGHVQLCHSMLGGSIKVPGIPEWLPDSYPAFSIATSDPLRMFLSMATAAHGHHGGVTQILKEIFQDRPIAISSYLNTLKSTLGLP